MITKKDIIISIIVMMVGFAISALIPLPLSKRELIIYLTTIFLTTLNIMIFVHKKDIKKYQYIPKFTIILFLILTLLFYILKLHYTISIILATILSYVIQLHGKKEKDLVNIIIHTLINIIFMHICLLKVTPRLLPICFLMMIFNYLYLVITYLLKNEMPTIEKIYKEVNNKWNDIINKKYLKGLFKFLPQNIFAFILLIISILTIIKFGLTIGDNYYVYANNAIKNNIGPITEKTKIDTDFINATGEFDIMCFKFDTYSRNNNTEMTFQIEESQNIIYEETFKTNDLKSGVDKCFSIEKTDIDKLKTYDIYMIPSENTTKDNAVTIYDDKDKNVIMSLGTLQKENVKTIKWGIIIFAFIAFIVMNYIINKKELTPEKYFLYCLIYIIPITLIIPPLQVPDEHFHFYKAYNLSFISFNEAPNKTINNEKILVPEDIQCIDYAGLGVANRLYTDETIPSCIESTDNEMTNNDLNGYKSFFGYFPQSIGIKIADLFTNSSFIIFFAGRFLSLLFAFSIIYLSIKITPKYKNLFLITATMMMFVQEMVSYSYDSVLNAVCFLFLALVLKLIYSDKKVSGWHILLIISILTIIIDIKAVYLPLALILFLIPKEKFDNKLSKKIIYLIVIAISSILLSGVIKYYFSYYNAAVASTDDISRLQISYLLTHPLSIIRIAINTFDIQFIFYLKSITGYFAYFTFGVSNVYIIVYILLFIYIILSEENKEVSINRVVLTTTFLISAIGIFAAMYLYSTEYMSPYVAGVQGRYFYPVMLPLAIALMPKHKKLTVKLKPIYSIISILLLQMMLVFGIWYY